MNKRVPECRLLCWRLPKLFSRNRKELKLAAMLFTTVLLTSVATSQTITFSGKKVSLQTAFNQIKKQTDYVVVFNPELIDTASVISVAAKSLPLEEFIITILANKPLSYTIVGTTIVVFRKIDKGSGTDGSLIHDIGGVVFDSEGQFPLGGVSIVLNGGRRGGQTDGKGSFLIKNVNRNDSITLSFIGYETVTIPIKNYPDRPINVSMKISSNELDQAVVQGYGITSKRLATGNISKVTAEEIEKQPVMNPLLALQGRVPGLNIIQTTGHSSSPVKVELRGRNSLNPRAFSDPLYIIDGLPITVLDVSGATMYDNVSPGIIQGGFLSNTRGQSPLFTLNPMDIESIEVLKDGDATAIYGSRAANGVILITTKKGKPGKTSFQVSVDQGITDVPRSWNMLNTQQYLQMRREAFKNDGITPTVANAPDLLVWDTTRYTDWQKEFLGTGKRTSVSAGLSGGNNQTTFNLNANYNNTTDVLSRTGSNQRSTLSFNITHHSPNNKLNVSFTGNYGYAFVDAINDRGNGIHNLPPNAPAIFDSEGNLNYNEWRPALPNLRYPFDYIYTNSNSKTNDLKGSLNVEFEIAKGLAISANAGYNNAQNTNDYFIPIKSQDPSFFPTGNASFGSTNNTTRIIEPQLKYTTFIGKGSLSIQGGGSQQITSTRGTGIFAAGYTNDDLIRSIGNSSFQQVSEGYSDYKYASIFGRINYNWENKYILNLNGRRDGSSRFGEGRQYGNFGSVGAAWIASEESWVSEILPSWFSFFKLRSSYAITGSDGVGDYQSLSQWSSNQGFFITYYDYNGIRAFVPVHAVNQDYRWESNKKAELALQLGFFKDMINIEIAYYQNNSGNQLTNLPTPIFSGFSSVTANWAASVRNHGVEISGNAKLISRKNLSWNLSFNIAANRNKLVAYPGIEYSPYFDRYKVGQSLSSRYLWQYAGVDPQTGRYSFVDYNLDGVVRQNYSVSPGTFDDDRYAAVDIAPKYYGGFGTDFSFAGFTVDLFFNFKKQTGDNPFSGLSAGSMNNIPVEALGNRWEKPGDQALYARYSTNTINTFTGSNAQLVDASYVRLSNIAASYSLRDKIVKKAGMNDFRIFINAQNIFTITNYPGIDPEVQSSSSLPTSRTFTGGISFNF